MTNPSPPGFPPIRFNCVRDAISSPMSMWPGRKEKAVLPSKQLLEEYPLYKRMQMVLPVQRHQWPAPAIVAPCATCGAPQTFNMTSDYEQYDEGKPMVALGYLPPASLCVRVAYTCAGCRRSHRWYLVRVSQRPTRSSVPGLPPETETEAEVQKVGQFPPWDIAPDPQLAKKLGDRVETFKKGLVCESQGYGIGAFAYYRRIVEQVIEELLDDIQTLVDGESAAEYVSALQEARTSRRAVDKIAHVKDLVPAVLRPGGANPLAVLHGTLSDGLHNLTEEECLEHAVSIREALVFLVAQIGQSKQSADQFKKRLQALVERQQRRPEE